MIASTGNYLANSAQSVTVLAGESFVVIIPMCPGWEKKQQENTRIRKEKGLETMRLSPFSPPMNYLKNEKHAVLLSCISSVSGSQFSLLKGRKGGTKQAVCGIIAYEFSLQSEHAQTDRQTDRQWISATRGKKSTEVKLCCYSALMYGT